MKQKKIMLFLGILIVFILSVSLGLMLYYGVGNDKKEEDSSSIDYLSQSSNPVQITVQNDYGEFNLVSAQSDSSSAKWTLKDFEDIPVYDTKIQTMGSQMKELKAEKVFAPQNALSSYGLEHPQATVTASYPDGSRQILQVGGQNPEKSGYYCKLDGRDEIALIASSSGKAYLCSQTDLVDTTLIPYVSTGSTESSSSPGVQECTITRNDLTAPITAKKDDNGNLVLISPEGKTLSQDNETLLLNAVSGLSAESVQLCHPTQEDLVADGLTQPIAKVSYTINNQTVTFSIGSVSHAEDTMLEEGKTVTKQEYYVMVEGRPVIYNVDETALPWLTINVE